MLEEFPTPSRVGTTKVGGIDLNKPRMRWVVEAVIALCLSLSPHGFTASELAREVRVLSNQSTSSGLKAMVALVVLRNKAIKPLLAAAQDLRPSRGAESQTARSELRNHSYGHASRLPGTGAGSLNIDNNFFKLRHQAPNHPGTESLPSGCGAFSRLRFA